MLRNPSIQFLVQLARPFKAMVQSRFLNPIIMINDQPAVWLQLNLILSRAQLMRMPHKI